MNQWLVAVAVAIILPVAAYLSGRSFAPPSQAETNKPAPEFADDVQSSAQIPFAIEDMPHVAFSDLYRSLRSSPPARRSDLVRNLRRIDDPRKRGAAISSLFKCFAMLDTDEAISFLSELESDKDKIKAVDALIKGAPSPATAALVKMLMSLPGPVGEGCRQMYLPGQISFWSAFDPVAAAQFIDDHPTQLEDISRTTLVSNWAALDPAAAEAWLHRHTDRSGLQRGPARTTDPGRLPEQSRNRSAVCDEQRWRRKI